MYQRDRLGQDEMTELTPVNAGTSPDEFEWSTEVPASFTYLAPESTTVYSPEAWQETRPLEPIAPSYQEETLPNVYSALSPETQAAYTGQLAPWQEYGEKIEPVTAPESTWSWADIWKPVQQVLTTGAEVFSKVYPVVTGTQPAAYPIAYPTTAPKPKAPTGYYYGPTGVLTPVPSGSYVDSTGILKKIPAGYVINPVTGGLTYVGTTGITGAAQSPYFWPLVIGVGALVLLSGKKRR